MTVETEYRKYVGCWLEPCNYAWDDSLALKIWNRWDGPIATITVCLGDNTIGKDEQYVDTNNCPWAEEFIAEYNLGKPTGKMMRSGYCEYPLYEFDLDELKKYAG